MSSTPKIELLLFELLLHLFSNLLSNALVHLRLYNSRDDWRMCSVWRRASLAQGITLLQDMLSDILKNQIGDSLTDIYRA
jgi:hypothetical protein